MAVRRILRVDQPDDLAILRQHAAPVQRFDAPLAGLITDMVETMHAANGVGLAAPQVGVSLRVAVIFIPALTKELPDGRVIELEPEQHYALVNPTLAQLGPHQVTDQEGCLSMPGWYADVPRANWVSVDYVDPQGHRRRIRRANGLLARALQHEIDHLDGVLFTDHVRDPATLVDRSAELKVR
ncbi:MAG: peptide deformylase [Chloroflexi bacterium]|nr:peptide deformylase [Chloroflexota bacterium]